MTGTGLHTPSTSSATAEPLSKLAAARLAISLVRNPLKALPPDIFSEPAVLPVSAAQCVYTSPTPC